MVITAEGHEVMNKEVYSTNAQNNKHEKVKRNRNKWKSGRNSRQVTRYRSNSTR
jgi:hypothetical protein